MTNRDDTTNQAVGMTTFEIFNWCGDAEAYKILDNLGYSHMQIIEGEAFEHAQEIYAAGLNVMLLHSKKNPSHATLAVDTKSFGQR